MRKSGTMESERKKKNKWVLFIPNWLGLVASCKPIYERFYIHN